MNMWEIKSIYHSENISIFFPNNHFEQVHIGAALMTIRQSKLTTSRVRSLHLINKSFEFLVFKLTLGKFFNSLLLILGKFNLYPENCIPYLLLNVYMHVRYPNKGFNQT